MGVACLAVPNLTSELLFGRPPATLLEFALARLVGAAILSLALACWFAARDSGFATLGVVKAMLFYDVIVIIILLYARFELGLAGTLLWPAVVIHIMLGAWCILELQRTEINAGPLGKDRPL